MKVLVGYATHHGSTREIAERIAAVLNKSGLDTGVAPVDRLRDLAGSDAIVVGSALYCGWLKEATEFVKRNRSALACRAVWLFSSGPLGTASTDAKGRDLRGTAIPKEIAELARAVQARDHRVFFGAYDPSAKPIGFLERSMRLVPNGRSLLEAGDFRDWDEIDAWARAIADELKTPAGLSAAGH